MALHGHHSPCRGELPICVSHPHTCCKNIWQLNSYVKFTKITPAPDELFFKWVNSCWNFEQYMYQGNQKFTFVICYLWKQCCTVRSHGWSYNEYYIASQVGLANWPHCKSDRAVAGLCPRTANFRGDCILYGLAAWKFVVNCTQVNATEPH